MPILRTNGIGILYSIFPVYSVVSYSPDRSTTLTSLVMHLLRSSSFRVPCSSSFLILSWSENCPGMTRSFPARIQPDAVQSSPCSVVVQSVMITPSNPHSCLAAAVQVSLQLAAWMPLIRL